MQFEIPVVDTRGKRSYIISLHLVVCFLLLVTGLFEFLLYIYFTKSGIPNTDTQLQYIHLLKIAGAVTFALGLGLLGFLLFKNKWLTNTKVNKTVRVLELIVFFLFSVIAFRYQILYPSIIFGIVCVTLLYALFWENKTQPKTILVTEDHIAPPGKSPLKWHELDNVILKHGIITIDCLDNRLLQWDIEKFNFNENDFSAFCKAKIVASVKDRVKNW